MTKLSDTQLIVLSSAAKHDEGLATRLANLNAAAAMKVASSLIAKGLAREIRAKADAPVWHEKEDGRFALKITKAAREAIGVEDEEAQEAASGPTAPAQPTRKGRGLRLSHQVRTRGRESGLTNARALIEEAAGQEAGCDRSRGGTAPAD
jgi:hypothetical protein